MVSRKTRGPRKLPTIEDVDGIPPLQTWIQPKPRNILALPVPTPSPVPVPTVGSATSTIPSVSTSLMESSSMKALPSSSIKSTETLARRSSISSISTNPSQVIGTVQPLGLPNSPSRQPLPLPGSNLSPAGKLPAVPAVPTGPPTDPDPSSSPMNSPNKSSKIATTSSSSPTTKMQTVVLKSQRAQPRNLNCEICLSLASFSSDVLNCIYCNVVCHAKCLQRFQSNLTLPQRHWVCFLCVDELDASRNHFESKRQAQIDLQLKTKAQIVISKYFRGYRARKFYIRIYTIIVRLQIMFNIRRRKRAFMFNTQAKLRPMKLYLVKCCGLVICDRDIYKSLMAAQSQQDSIIESTTGSSLAAGGSSHHRGSSVSSSVGGGEDKGFRGILNENISHSADDDDDMSVQSMQSNATGYSVGSTATQQSKAGNGHGSGKKSGKNKRNKSNLKKKEYEIYVLITVVDQSRGELIQSWRLLSSIKKLTLYPNSTFDLTFEESIMLGGVSGFNTIVLSCFQKGIARDTFLGQTAIDLSENYIWRKGGFFQAIPLTKAEYEIRDNIGMEMKADYRAQPKGTITFELTAYRGMSSECGYCNATCAEDIIRVIGKGANEYPGYINAMIHSVNIGGHHHAHHSTTSNSAAGTLSDTNSTGNAATSTSTDTTTTTTTSNGHNHGHGHHSYGHTKVKYGTMLPLNTPFQDTHGNPIKKAWLAIAEGFVFIYSHFGDQLKLAIDLSQFMYSFQFKGKSMVIYQLSRPNYPPFVFYPMDVSEMLRWKCAFLSSIHAIKAKDVPLSSSSSGSDKFDVSYLINDLLAMDQLKPRKAGKNGVVEPLTAHPLMRTLSNDNLAIPTHALVAPPTNESMLANPSVPSVTASIAAAAIGSGMILRKAPSENSTKANSPKHKSKAGRNGGIEDESQFSLAKVASGSAHKSLLTYKPKENKIDLSKSMTVAIPEFNFTADANGHTTKNKVLASIFHSHSSTMDSNSKSDEHGNGNSKEKFLLPEHNRSNNSTRNLAEMIQESYDLDDVVTNPKYQQYGEKFVSRLMTGNLVDQFVKPLQRTPTNRNKSTSKTHSPKHVDTNTNAGGNGKQ